MAFDARKEDYQRMSLRFARSLDGEQGANLRAYAAFAHRFSTQRDSLPQTDADRAFHLVADATTLVDYRLPFATDEEAETIVDRARKMLDEALALDAHCYDALRMRRAADTASFEEYYRFLCDNEREVREHCERARDEALGDESSERVELAVAIAAAPYVRWVAALAEKALVCGRNREALRHAARALEWDPHDVSDTRFTAAYAYAKLEDEQGLDRFEATMRDRRKRAADDAWTLLARACLAHRRRDYDTARARLMDIVATYPNAATILARQVELPDGVFARLAVAPYSEDELVVAVSEGTVLLQEGRDALDMGVFGSWVVREALGLATSAQLGELHDVVEYVGRGGTP